MILYIGITLVLALAYVLLLCYLLSRWNSHPSYNISDPDPSLGLSILIPARNEADNISRCLQFLLDSCTGLYNPIEIIVIDDHSEDETATIAASLNDDKVKVLKLSDHLKNGEYNAYKKLALGIGLQQAAHAYVLQVDADVIVPPYHLKTILSILTTEQPDLLAAPVLLTGLSSFQKFQTLDLMGMMAVTAAGIRSGRWHIANGANLCYKKQLVDFKESDTASGDDVSTIQRLAVEGKKILFCKSIAATVSTPAMSTWPTFYQQRIRWATKNKFQSSGQMKGMMAVPFLNCLLLLLHLPLWVVFGHVAVVLFFFHLMVKLGIDYVYLKELAEDFENEEAMGAFIYSSVLHPLYIAGVGLASLFVRRYEWKGRKVS